MFTREKLGFLAIAAGAMIMAAPSISAVPADPTPSAIASAWATLGGGKEGMVAYSYNDSVYIMTLKTGMSKSIAKAAQAVLGTSTDWGKASALRFSPDGKRLAFEGQLGIFVFNIDGSNFHLVTPFTPSGDQISISWDGNDKIVYSPSVKSKPPFVVNSTVINADNSAGATTVIWTSATDTDPTNGQIAKSQGLVSIGKSGDYLSFDIQTSNPNIPIIVKLSTKVAKNPTGTGDGCQIRMWPDSSGTVSYHIDSHLKPATLYNYVQDKVLTTTVPQPTAAQGACGNGGFNWSYDKNFMIQTGDNDLGTSPGCISAGRIRKTDWSTALFLGDKINWPDLWVGTPSTGLSTPMYETLHSSKSQVWVLNNTLSIKGIEGKTIASMQLINLSGKVIAKGDNLSATQQNISVGSLPQGVYVVSWKESGVLKSRHLNVLSGFASSPNFSVSL